MLLAGNRNVIDLARAEQRRRSRFAQLNDECIGNYKADCGCEALRLLEPSSRVLLCPASDMRTDDEGARAARNFGVAVVEEVCGYAAQSSSLSPWRSTGVAGWIVETACL
jgi:hypothetical protein